MTNDDIWKAGQRLTRDWKRGKLTTEQFEIASLKLSVDLKERAYLRCAFHLLEAKKLLAQAAEDLEQAWGQNPTSEAIHACLSSLEATDGNDV